MPCVCSFWKPGMTDTLSALAARMGVVPAYTDQTGRYRVTSPDSQRALLAAMGVDTASESAMRDRLAAETPRPGALPRWHVARVGSRPDLGLADDAAWHILREDGRSHEGRGPRLPVLPLGRHRLEVGREACTLLMAPARLPLPPRSWGLIVPLAGLRTAAEGGIGDYADLGRLAEGLAPGGAAFLGINPVHAGFPTDPTAFSPYTPSHRRRLSSLHIPVEHVRSRTKLIDYATDIPARMASLEQEFARAEAMTQSAAFDTYCAQEGDPLTRFALHQALSERHGPYWHTWPVELQDPNSPAVAEAATTLRDRVRFHTWLQWRAETELDEAAHRARAAGMGLGLYLDLAVGTHPHGAETWEDRGSFAFGASLGAPPDAFSEGGQNWSLAPFNPHALIEGDFAALAETLRRQLRFSGMLRIDHILGFDRAFWVPDVAEGAYVQLPLDAMLAVVRIEAARAGAVVVGEDLGNIPDGLQRALVRSGILGCRLTIFEQTGRRTRRFRKPSGYAQAAIASFSTHDLPTWKGWRVAREVTAREERGLMDAEASARAQMDRRAEVAALDTATATFSAAPPEATARLHSHLAAAGSRLVAVQIENVLEMIDQPNLPGTTTQYPNWQQRLPLGIDEIINDPRLIEVAAIMKDNER